MTINTDKLQSELCKLLCTEVRLYNRNNKIISIETPFFFPDGDPYQIYLKEMPNGIIRLSDMGHTLMHLSYENDIDKFREGTRGKIFNQILAETSIKEDNGEFFIETNINSLVQKIFHFGQALTKVNDLTFLNRIRAESTFYDDLKEYLYRIIPESKITKDYIFESIDNSKDYPIDFFIEGKYNPLLLFGIPNKDKARLTTIILERLLRAQVDFDSILIFSDQTSIPRPDLARLSNTGGEMIASLDAVDDIKRKIYKKVAA